jgi:hypothetical protein
VVDGTGGYHAEGNLSSKTQKVNGQPTGTHTNYTWDYRNRLVEVQEKPSPTSGTITRVIDQVG